MGDAPSTTAAMPKLLELDKEDVKAVRQFPAWESAWANGGVVFGLRSQTLTS